MENTKQSFSQPSPTAPGYLTVGFGGPEERKIRIVDYFRATFKDHRLITMSELEAGSFYLSVENPTSTGRAILNQMWLSKDSFTGLVTLAMLAMRDKEMHLAELLKQMEQHEIRYEKSKPHENNEK